MIGLIALFWLGLILSTFVWLVVKVKQAVANKKQTNWLAILLPLGVFIFLTLPMFGQPIADELSCRFAGIHLSPPVDAKKEGIYWHSISPNPNAYSMGFVYEKNNSTPAIMAVLRRALLEGRFAYLELPAGSSNYQRILLTRTRGIDNGKTHCLSDLEGNNVSPENWPDVCIAYQTVPDISSRYEIITRKLDNYNTGSLTIIDRSKVFSNQIAKYSIGSVSSSEMIPRLPTPSCTPEKLDSLPLSNLILMQFTDRMGKVFSRNDIVKFEDQYWRPLETPDVGTY